MNDVYARIAEMEQQIMHDKIRAAHMEQRNIALQAGIDFIVQQQVALMRAPWDLLAMELRQPTSNQRRVTR